MKESYKVGLAITVLAVAGSFIPVSINLYAVILATITTLLLHSWTTGRGASNTLASGLIYASLVGSIVVHAELLKVAWVASPVAFISIIFITLAMNVILAEVLHELADSHSPKKRRGF